MRVGGVSRGDQWTEVPLPGRVQFPVCSVTPLEGDGCFFRRSLVLPVGPAGRPPVVVTEY